MCYVRSCSGACGAMYLSCCRSEVYLIEYGVDQFIEKQNRKQIFMN